jgi:hypothetical protein
MVTAQMSVFAAPIGVATVPTQADTSIEWDGNFPGTATGTVTGIKVLATVAPTINVAFSTNQIDLGTLTAGVTASGSIDIEVGTNAANGVSITAQSGSGGLTNTSNASLQINNLLTDGSQEDYLFTSTANLADSTVAGFDGTTGDLALTQMTNDTPITIYETNKPEITDGVNADVTFRVEATSNAQTAAGDYEDTLNFTVVGNF